MPHAHAHAQVGRLMHMPHAHATCSCAAQVGRLMLERGAQAMPTGRDVIENRRRPARLPPRDATPFYYLKR